MKLPSRLHLAGACLILPLAFGASAAGRTLYNGFCGSCHGLNAISGGVLPDLRYLDARKHAQVKDILLMGARAAKGMPPFAGTVSDADAERIHQYLIKRAHDLRQETARARP